MPGGREMLTWSSHSEMLRARPGLPFLSLYLLWEGIECSLYLLARLGLAERKEKAGAHVVGSGVMMLSTEEGVEGVDKHRGNPI